MVSTVISLNKIYSVDSNAFVKHAFDKISKSSVEKKLNALRLLAKKHIVPSVGSKYEYVKFCLPWVFLTGKKIDYHCCNCSELETFADKKSVALYLKIKGDLR